MKIVRYLHNQKEYYGILEEGVIRRLDCSIFDQTYQYTQDTDLQDQVTLLAPCTPSKVICIGLNYKDHAKELAMELPQEPLMFLKPPSSVIGPNQRIVRPTLSNQIDYEGELAIVIGKAAKNLTVEQAPSHILGYTCANDITARDLQRKDGQWTRAKSFDTFMPLGPWIVRDIDPSNLEITTRLNGQMVQHSNTEQMVFSPFQVVSAVSQVMTLEPGDVIITGTPYGVGQLKAGDTVEIEIQSIGTLLNMVD